MSIAENIIKAATSVKGVVDARVDTDDRSGMLFVTVVYDPNLDADSREFKFEVEQSIRAQVTVGIGLSISWQNAVIGIDWAEPEDQALRERIRQKVLEQYPAAGDGIKGRGLGGPW